MSEVANKPKRQYRRKADTLEARVEAVELSDESIRSDDAAVANAPPPPPMLTQDELFKLRLFQAEVARAIAEAETCRMRKKWILALLDPKGSVDAEEKRIDKWRNEAKTFATKYETMKARISMRLNLDLDKCGFDPETGLVVPPTSAKG